MSWPTTQETIRQGENERRHFRSLTLEAITMEDILSLLSLKAHASNIKRAMRESAHPVMEMIPEGREYDAVCEAFTYADRVPEDQHEMFETFRQMVREAALIEARNFSQ